MVPSLGVFIACGDGRILFSELMRSDDGVLRSAVASERGVGEAEAAHIVERFSTEIRHTLERGMSYRLEGLGVLSTDERGRILFRSRENELLHRMTDHASHGVLDRILAESAAADAAEPEQRASETAAVAEQTEPERQSAAEESPTGDDAAETVATVANETAAQPGRSAVDDVYVGSEAPSGGRPKRKGGVDMFIIVAIVVAVVAVSAIAYGLWTSFRYEHDDAEPFEAAVEQSEPSQQGGDTGSVSGEVVDLSMPSGGKYK